MEERDAETEAGRAFLQWIDRGGVESELPTSTDVEAIRSWGELLIARRRGNSGDRPRYDLRHVDDAGADAEELETYGNSLDARRIAKFDDRDRYRPLKTAPTLPGGWVFPDLGPGELLDAVDFFYPATIANWYREREGDLDVTHWRETAERQTGIYDDVDELSPEALEWAAEACCVDSQCLKRRRWDYDEDRDLDVPRGDGEFPCREPCSFLIAAAREWALLEREESRDYDIELTRSEREQLGTIVDAVADGRTGEIREADFGDPANRHRVRYLRAKRFGRHRRSDASQETE